MDQCRCCSDGEGPMSCNSRHACVYALSRVCARNTGSKSQSRLTVHRRVHSLWVSISAGGWRSDFATDCSIEFTGAICPCARLSFLGCPNFRCYHLEVDRYPMVYDVTVRLRLGGLTNHETPSSHYLSSCHTSHVRDYLDQHFL